MKKIALTAIIAAFASAAFAQESTSDVPAPKKERTAEHLIGMQVNGLVRQVLNFSNNNTNVNTGNPYLLTYSVNSKKTGWGLRAGVGYAHNSSSGSDGFSSIVNNIDDMNVRIGVDKRFKLSGRWTTGVGLDMIYSRNNDNTSTDVNQTFSGIGSTGIQTLTTAVGGGPMAWLRFGITNRIIIGTEASIYYKTGNESQTINSMVFIPNGTLSQPSTSRTVSEAKINAPVALFLNVKL